MAPSPFVPDADEEAAGDDADVLRIPPEALEAYEALEWAAAVEAAEGSALTGDGGPREAP